MGNRGNWYQQHQREPGRLLTGAAFPNNKAFTLHGPGCMAGTGREGPPARGTSTMSSAARCWSVNDIQRNTPQRRSWPGQSRQSGMARGVWQQPTNHIRTNKINPAPSRQVQSQTTHRHIAQLGVMRRARTSTDFALAGRTSQAYRGAVDGHSSTITSSTLPKVPGTTREGVAFHAPISNGLVDRASTLKSLASNPHLQVETVNGTTRIFRTADRRPRSLPAKFSESPLSESTLPPEVAEPQKVFYVSKHGFHPRSKSPTYPILIGTKDTLNLALCKKLWGIRRNLEGRKARENSVVFSEISQALVDETETEQWYEKMFDEHEQDDDADVDAEMVAIERLQLANLDGQFAQSDESISTLQPRPRVDLVFDRKYLKEHINDWAILGIDIEEEELKTAKRLKTASVARPTSASRKPSVPTQTTNTKPGQSHRQTAVAKREANPTRPNRERRGTRLPAVPTAGRVFRARDSRKKKGKRTTKKPTLAEQSDDELWPNLTNGDDNSRTPSPTFEPATNGDLDDMDRRKSLISKYLLSPKPGDHSSPVPKEHEDETVEEPDPAKSPDQVQEEEEKPKELTEKEKFVLMRKRMDDRKAKMQKRREDYLDYSMLGMRSQRRRTAGEAGGAPSPTKNSLGSLMSTRLESMATFKTRQYQGEEIDDDDEDEDEDEDDDDDEDNSSEEDDS